MVPLSHCLLKKIKFASLLGVLPVLQNCEEKIDLDASRYFWVFDPKMSEPGSDDTKDDLAGRIWRKNWSR